MRKCVKKRDLTDKWTHAAIVDASKNTNELRHAWINFGLYLPMDGSEDGNIDSIVK